MQKSKTGEIEMSMFGNHIWATGEMNPSNFALNTEIAKARQASRASGTTTSDTMIGSPLANNSPEYPVIALGGAYMEAPHSTKVVGLGLGVLAATVLNFGIQNLGIGNLLGLSSSIGTPLLIVTEATLLSIPITKSLNKGRKQA